MPSKNEVDAWTASMRQFRAKLKRLSSESDRDGVIGLENEFAELMEYTQDLLGQKDA